MTSLGWSKGPLAAALLAGCGSSTPKVSIVLDLPDESSDAYPFGNEGIDTLRLSIATAGDANDLMASTSPVDQPVEITDAPFGDNLVVHLHGERDGSLIAYGRSCPFDVVDSEAGTEEVFLFFSRIVRWSAGQTPIAEQRLGGHAIARNSGVLFAGGETDAPLEFLNLRSGTLTELTEAPATQGRSGSVLARLSSDQAIIVGGADLEGPVTTLETLPDLRLSIADGLAVRNHRGVSLVGDGALVVGGETWNGTDYTPTASAWEFGLGDGGIPAPPREVGSMSSPRTRHSVTRLGNEPGSAILVAGGLDDLGLPVATTEVFRPLSKRFEPVAGVLNRWDHAAITFPGGDVLILGGFTQGALPGSAVPDRQLLLFDPVQSRFEPVGTLPSDAAITDFSLTALPDGRVLLTGGRSEDGSALSSAFILRLDPIDGQVDVSRTDSTAMPRDQHAAVLACDGTVIVAGGSTESGAPLERYNPTEQGRR